MTNTPKIDVDTLYKIMKDFHCPPDPDKHYNFSVLLKNYEDLENFYNEMETKGIGTIIRDVKCTNRKPISRATIYSLTPIEAEQLKEDSRVEDIHLTMEARGLCFSPSSTTETASWDKSSNLSSSMKNWALLRCTNGKQIANWGSDGTASQGNMITLSYTGKNVDVVIMDGTIDPNHPEFAANADGTGGSRMVLFNWLSLTNAVSGGTNGTYDYTVDTAGHNSSHGHNVGSIAVGNTCGWARNANIYNLNPYGVNGMAMDDLINYIRAWHKQKPINPLTGTKNPTIVNMSFGLNISIWTKGGDYFDGNWFGSWTAKQAYYGYQYGVRPVIFGNVIQSITYRGVTHNPPSGEANPINGTWDADTLTSLGCRLYEDFAVQGFYGVLCGLRDSTMDAEIIDATNEGIVFVGAAGNNWQTQNEVIGGPDYDNYIVAWDDVQALNYQPYINLNTRTNLYSNYYYTRGVSPSCAQSGTHGTANKK